VTGGRYYDPDHPLSHTDLWISTDRGVSWVEQTPDPENHTNFFFYPRWYHGCVALPDGSILVVGGTAVSTAPMSSSSG